MSSSLFPTPQNSDEQPRVNVFPGLHEPKNFEPRAHCGILFDQSGSMASQESQFLPAWQAMLKELVQIPSSRLRLEIGVGSFSSHVTFHDFAPIPHFLEARIKLRTDGLTNLGCALRVFVDRMLARRQQLVNDGIQVHPSVLIVITDGAATDTQQLAEILPTLRRLENENVVEVVPIALDEQHRPLLKQVFGKEATTISGLDFEGLFKAIAKSMATYSRATIGLEPRAGELIRIAYKQESLRLEDLRRRLPPKNKG